MPMTWQPGTLDLLLVTEDIYTRGLIAVLNQPKFAVESCLATYRRVTRGGNAELDSCGKSADSSGRRNDAKGCDIIAWDSNNVQV